MAETFEILAGFLERYGTEVEGRHLAEPGEETKNQLRQLAGGNLPEAEQGKLYELLNQNPQWVGWLANELKALRPPAA